MGELKSALEITETKIWNAKEEWTFITDRQVKIDAKNIENENFINIVQPVMDIHMSKAKQGCILGGYAVRITEQKLLHKELEKSKSTTSSYFGQSVLPN